MEFSQKVLNHMESRGVSAYKVAKATGISESTFSKWKKSPTSKIDTSLLSKIANYFNVSTDYLLGNEQKKNPTTNESDEAEVLQDAITTKILNTISKLNPEYRKIALAQLEALVNLPHNEDN